MRCPFIINQYGNPQECEGKHCALWIEEKNCCSIKAIANNLTPSTPMPQPTNTGTITRNDVVIGDYVYYDNYVRVE